MNKRIAIPVEDGMLCEHFGHCEYFYVADLENNKIDSTTTSSSIIYGIIKIREKNATLTQWNEERTRDMKFIITPIENWRD